MLASTVQFSTYDQTPATRPHQPATPTGTTAVCDADRPCKTTVTRSLRTQQRAYEPAPPGHPPPSTRVGPPASGVTDFRDVTGGVYKARERIHRSVADLRLLATPTSWGRVADPNPN